MSVLQTNTGFYDAKTFSFLCPELYEYIYNVSGNLLSLKWYELSIPRVLLKIIIGICQFYDTNDMAI